MHCVCSPDCSRANFRKSDVSDLARLHKFLQSGDRIFDRSLRIEPVLVIQIDVIGAQPPQRTFDGRLDMSRTAVESEHFPVRTKLHRKLRCNDYILAPLTFHCTTKEFLILEGTIHFSRVPKVHTDIEGMM